MFILQTIRKDFPALSQQVYGKPLIYFDNAATTHKPAPVIALVNEMNSFINGNIHRAFHCLGTMCTERYEEARETVRAFLHASSVEEIVFTAGTTAAINTVAFSFGERFVHAGDDIVITEAEHHSNIVPWQLLCERKGALLKVLPVNHDGSLPVEQLPRLLSKRTKLLCVTQASNVLGVMNPVKDIVAAAHACGVPVLVDGAQGAVHGGIDVQDAGCDFYVFSGHKLYGPTGTGVLYGRQELLDEMPPWQGGGEMIAAVSFEKTTYAGLPLKFEAGTPNFIGVCGLKKAIDYVQELGWAQVREQEETLVRHATRRLQEIEGLQLYGAAQPKTSLLSFNIAGIHPTDAAQLLDKMGIAARSGHLCADPLMRRFNVQGMLRFSFSFYNTTEEIDTAVDALKKIKQLLSCQ
ncbi:MAG: SufS family cysteine desulfurase [Prevotellaceae bacterium]|jgi:cysteine desulfurase/selenocysteine lyase|nr:SufS family cysteine desulfurase [Prevotellaceae bacterium]